MNPLAEKMLRVQIDPIMKVYGTHIEPSGHLDNRANILDEDISFDVARLESGFIGYTYWVKVKRSMVKFTAVWNHDEFEGTRIEVLGREFHYDELSVITAKLTTEIYHLLRKLDWRYPENVMQTVGY